MMKKVRRIKKWGKWVSEWRCREEEKNGRWWGKEKNEWRWRMSGSEEMKREERMRGRRIQERRMNERVDEWMGEGDDERKRMGERVEWSEVK
jgi:hypothetical protein